MIAKKEKMKNLVNVLALACVIFLTIVGCQPTNDSHPTSSVRASQLSTPISLKNLTTGVKAEKLDAHWSYFGKERNVQIEQLPDGAIVSISVSMEGGDAYNLRNELEAKYSKDEGREVRFDCSMNDRRLAILSDARVWDTVCTLHSKEQVLTIYEVGPDDPKLISDHYSLRALFYSTKVTLVNTRLAALYKKTVEQAEANAKTRQNNEEKKELERAKHDI